MLQKENPSIKSKTFEQNEDEYICLVLPKYNIFSVSTALKKLQKIITCFTEDKLSTIYPDFQIQNVFNAWFSNCINIYTVKTKLLCWLRSQDICKYD